jgi:putative intracellular protease/amidase
MKKINTTKSDLLKAFDQSETKTIANACHIVGIVPSTFYYHIYKDADFRQQVLEKRGEFLAAKVAAETNNNGGVNV